jgi:hypothetical protein
MPSVVGVMTKGAAFNHLIDGGGVKGSSGNPPDSGGEIVATVKTATGAPTHAASEGTICWNSVDDKFYVNNNGSTGWTEVGAGGGYTHPNHSGDVTSVGDGAQTVQPAAITGKPSATVAGGDLVLISDIDAANALKQVTAQSIADLASGTGDVLGPATSVDHSIARFNGTNNKTIQDSLIRIEDDGFIGKLASPIRIGIGAGFGGVQSLEIVGSNLDDRNWKLTSTADGSNPIFEAVGDPTDVGATIRPKGDGVLTIGGRSLFQNYIDHTAISLPTAPASGNLRIFPFTLNGKTRWVIEDQDSTTYVLGRDNVLSVEAGEDVAKGECVYISGSSGLVAIVSKYVADGTIATAPLGIMLEAVTTGANGFVMMAGIMGMDATGLSAGAELWASAATPGALTTTEPTHPNLKARLGTCIQTGAVFGLIEVESLVVRGDHEGTRLNQWKVGTNTAGNKDIVFRNGFDLTLRANPTAARTVTIPDATVTLAAHAGDISGGTAAAPAIPNDTVTYAKMQDITDASRLLGRGSAAGAGDPEQITLGSNLSMSGTTLNATGGGGDSITVNGVAVVDADFDDATPSAPASSLNVRFQKDASSPANISANLPYTTSLEVSGGNLRRSALTGDVTASAGNNATTLVTQHKTRCAVLKIENPKANDEFPMLYVGDAATVVAVRAVTDVGTVNFNLEKRGKLTPDQAGTDVDTTDFVASVAGIEQTSGFESAGISADQWLSYVCTSVASGPSAVWVTVEYTIT